MTTSKARDSDGSPSSCQNAKSYSASAAVIIVQATTPAVLRENERMPMRPLMAAPAPGSSGISQMYFIYDRITFISSMLTVSLLR